MIYGLPQFKNIENEIKQKTSSLINENNKDTFRSGCFYLADYLIKNKNPPQLYNDYKKTWKGALNYWLKNYYRNLDKHGGCPLILEEKDKKFLKLKYEEVDFCEMKNEYLREIKRLSKISKDSDTYRSMCNAYNEWIEQKKNYFEDKKSSFKTCYGTKGQKKKKKGSSVFICDLMNPQTFQKISDCQAPNKLSPPEALSESTQKDLKSQDQKVPRASITATVPSDQGHLTKFSEKAVDKEISPDFQEIQKELQSTPPQELPSNVQISLSETPNIGSEPSSTGDMQVKPSQHSAHFQAPPPEASTFYKPPEPVSQSSEILIDAETARSHRLLIPDVHPPNLPTVTKNLGITNHTYYTIFEITTINNIYF
ncbi:PIR Superfamily Protein [Plasmodium malariae]|uniref:PIR Superfamily Protein n=1 Tax=Plasmodium malariae TaxID=5858 RepID=A0A1A8XA67_PLAMA|nr:PIR Superfamily Protein [Plasmodium malariae]